MTAGGWLMMLLSCGTVTALVVFCYARLLRHDLPASRDSTDQRRRDGDADSAGAAEP